MRIHRSRPERDFTVIPNATLRDQRLSTAARGVLVELLSRPTGWRTTADAMSEDAHRKRPDHAEGRRAMRAAFAELEACGYLVRTKVRDAGGRWQTEFDLYDTPDFTRGTASGMSAATSMNGHSPSSHRGTAYGTSVGGTSIERQIKKNEEEGSGAPDVIASGFGSDAIASPRDSETSSRQRGSKSLEAHLMALGEDTVEEILTDLADQRSGAVEWGVRKAREQFGLPAADDWENWGTGRVAARACSLALLALNKQGGIPPATEDLLDGWVFPEPALSEVPESAPRERERTWTEYLSPATGADAKTVLNGLYLKVDEMRPSELRAADEAFAANRPRIHRECVESAEEQLQAEGTEATAVEVTRLALKYGLRHYAENWPKWLVPPSAVSARQ